MCFYQMWLFVSVYVSSSTSKLSARLCTFLIHKAERHVETSGFHIIRSQLPVLELRSMFKLRVSAFRLSSVFTANSVLIGLFISRCISSEKNNPEILQFLHWGQKPAPSHQSLTFLEVSLEVRTLLQTAAHSSQKTLKATFHLSFCCYVMCKIRGH